MFLKATIPNFTIATLLLLTVVIGAGAAAMGKVWRIGYLDQGSAARNTVYLDGLRQGLRERGWVEGQNITIEPRFAEGHTDRLPELATELVRLKMDVIVTSTTPAALAAKQATTTIPVVFGFAADPVGSKIVTSLARPGANITGVDAPGSRTTGQVSGVAEGGRSSGEPLRCALEPRQPSTQAIVESDRSRRPTTPGGASSGWRPRPQASRADPFGPGDKGYSGACRFPRWDVSRSDIAHHRLHGPAPATHDVRP
jgi:ABC transporter substrate binding protein